MKTLTSSAKGTISLPVQMLNWKLIKKTKELKKIIFQFDVKMFSGHKVFSLVAYPAYRVSGKWKFGRKVGMSIPKKSIEVKLKLPLTVGNLEMKYNNIEKKFGPKVSKLMFTPCVYKQNPHVAYSVTDGLTVANIRANPCPPAKPGEEQQ